MCLQPGRAPAVAMAVPGEAGSFFMFRFPARRPSNTMSCIARVGVSLTVAMLSIKHVPGAAPH
jgi:hypothetical protein